MSAPRSLITSMIKSVEEPQTSFPVFPADDKRSGLEVRDNHDAVCVLEELLGDALIRRRHDNRSTVS